MGSSGGWAASPAIFIQEYTDMGIDAEQIVEVAPQPAAPEYPQPAAYAPSLEPAPQVAVAAAPPVPAPGAVAEFPSVAAPKRSRPGWIAPAAIAVVGLIASGSLGYLLYSTSNKLDATRHDLTETQLKLDSTTRDLEVEKAQAAYVQLYETDTGRLSTDYATVTECDSYSLCKSAAEAMLSDVQAFQEDHQTAKVPTAYANVDAMLGDSLTAEITALKALISAISTNDMDKVQNAYSDFNDATMTVFKTESSLAKLIA
jgi:hypothetical protein